MNTLHRIVAFFTLALPLMPALGWASQPTIFTCRAPESLTDRRYDYDMALLKLALDKTKETWGDYTMVPSPTMNFSRAINMLRAEKLTNPMFKLSATNEYCEDFSYAPFPIDLGIVGYRLFFTSAERNAELEKIKTINDLKRLTIGQGFGWLDTDILTAGGFQVVSVPSYESLFHMVTEKRFDLFSRGVNEVEMEYTAHRNIPGLTLNRNMGLHYPLPRFFFTNKSSAKAAQRVYEGLVKAHKDGSLRALWEKEYRSSLDFAEFNKVKFFEVPNPFIDRIDPSYKQFLLKVQ